MILINIESSFLSACSRDGTAKLWNCGRGECDSTLIDCGSVINACSLCSQDLAAAKDRELPDGKVFFQLLSKFFYFNNIVVLKRP